jgi:hypothetical protein
MSLPKFEHVKRNHPKLADWLDQLNVYICTQLSSGAAFLLPKLAAAKLGLTDGEAFILLELLAREGILHRVYNVRCRETDTLLATVDSIDALDDIPHCDDCDSDHPSSDLRVEIAFKPVGDGLMRAA